MFHGCAKRTISRLNQAIRGRAEALTELELTELNTNTKVVFRHLQARTPPPPAAARGGRELIDLNTNTKVVLWVAKGHVSAGPVPEEALLN